MVVNFINEVIASRNLWSKNYSLAHDDLADSDEIVKLVGSMKSGEVDLIVHVDTNPVFHTTDYDYASALKKVPTKVALTMVVRDVQGIDLVLPMHHYLESWGDSHSRVGIYNLRQPVIQPLYGTREQEEGTRQWEHMF